jgi:hypothetical protein
MMLATSFNATSDWIGIAILLLAIGLLTTNDLVSTGGPWLRVRRIAEVLLTIGAVAVIGWRFIVMI